MREPAELVNFSDLAQKREFMQRIQPLKGLWEIRMKERRLTRTLQANRFYFAAVVLPWRNYLREAYGDNRISSDDAHEALKEVILGRTETDIKGLKGQKLTLGLRTRDMDIPEFSEYIEQCCEFLASFAGIVVLDSQLFIQEQTRKAS